MTSLVRRTLWVGSAAAIAALLVWAFLHGRGDIAREQAREAPVVPPTRVRAFGDQAGIVLDAATEQRMGIVTVPLAEESRAARVSLTGALVSDPNETEHLRAPVAGRLGGFEQRRWPALGDDLIGGEILGQVSDAQPFAPTRSGTVTSVGARPGEIVQAGQELLTITNFSRPLARIVWRPDAPADIPRTVRVTPIGLSGSAAPADLVGSAAQADSLTGAAVFLYRLRHAWPGARPGLPVSATFSDPRATRHGIFIPAAAAVQWSGFLWVYVQRGQGLFARLRVDTSAPVDGGWLTSVGIAPGDTVVVRGAEQLLSEEFRAGSAPAGEEPGR